MVDRLAATFRRVRLTPHFRLARARVLGLYLNATARRAEARSAKRHPHVCPRIGCALSNSHRSATAALALLSAAHAARHLSTDLFPLDLTIGIERCRRALVLARTLANLFVIWVTNGRLALAVGAAAPVAAQTDVVASAKVFARPLVLDWAESALSGAFSRAPTFGGLIAYRAAAGELARVSAAWRFVWSALSFELTLVRCAG